MRIRRARALVVDRHYFGLDFGSPNTRLYPLLGSPCDASAQGRSCRPNTQVIVLCLCTGFMIVEFVGGYLANSLAIMTDAAHLLSDASGFALSIFSMWVASRKSGSAHSYGYHRAEVLGALASVISLWAVTLTLVVSVRVHALTCSGHAVGLWISRLDFGSPNARPAHPRRSAV